MTTALLSPFRWREVPRPSVMLEDHSTHTPLYRQWRARLHDGCKPLSLEDFVAQQTAPKAKVPTRKAGGIARNAGTMHGLSKRADKLLAPRPNQISIEPRTPLAQLAGPGGVKTLPEVGGRRK